LKRSWVHRFGLASLSAEDYWRRSSRSAAKRSRSARSRRAEDAGGRGRVDAQPMV